MMMSRNEKEDRKLRGRWKLERIIQTGQAKPVDYNPYTGVWNDTGNEGNN